MSRLTVSELFRPWLNLGLQYILKEEKGTFDSQLFYQNDFLKKNKYQQKYIGESREHSLTTVESKKMLSVKKNESKPSKNSKYDVSYSSKETLPVKDWPELWKLQFLKTKPAPILWTYNDLFMDLSGKGSKTHAECLKKIIGILSLPKGSSTFWPCHIFNEEKIEKRPDIFFSAINNLSSKLVIIIGANSVPTLEDDFSLSVPFTQQIVRGVLYVLLPDFSVLISNSGMVERSCLYLRSVINSLGII